MAELNDEDVVPAIRSFVRSNTHIEVYEHIVRGCNGDVYFGKRKKLGDEVVLKFYWSHPHYDEAEEAVILQNIKHDNILQIHHLEFVPPHYAYFLTPKIDGGDLQALIEAGSISTKEALKILSGILLGLTELHSKHKLVHRDLKPGNILINLADKRPIIADLGAVKKIEDATGHVTASKSTFYYLPPEALQHNQYYFQSDIYQVGLIMFQLLGGHFPIDEPYKWLTAKERTKLGAIRNGTDRQKQFDDFIGKRITKGTIANIDTLPFYIDSSFKRVLNKALHNNHKKRFKDPSQFLTDIHQLIRSSPDYFKQPDLLTIKHEGEREFRIYKDKKDKVVLEKQLDNKGWRKDNGHNGTVESALSIARKNK